MGEKKLVAGGAGRMKTIQETAAPRCLVCRDQEARFRFERRGISFVKCGRCGLIYQEAPPAEKDRAYYEEGYYESFGEAHRLIQDARRTIYEDFLSREIRGRRGRLLDIGAGHGDFLKKIEEAGWEGWGIEPSHAAARAAREFLGGRILNRTVESADFPENHFDIITLWNVIDCLPDPRTSLEKIQTWLRPGGLLLIRTPNAFFHWMVFRFYEQFKNVLKKIGWKKEASVFLRSNFNSKNLKILLEKCGFSGIRIENGRPTRGDAYGVFSRSFFMDTAKLGIYLAASFVGGITAGKILMGSNLIVRATKANSAEFSRRPGICHSAEKRRLAGWQIPGRLQDPQSAIQNRIILKRLLLHFLAGLGYLLGLPLWFKLLGKDREIRILRYHGVNELRKSDLNVKESEFRRQLDFLKERYSILSLDEALQALEKKNLPGKAGVAITFDDGYRDNYKVAFPVLREKNIPAAIFLLSGGEGPERLLPHLKDDEPEYNQLLPWDEVREMAASQITLGSHGENHVRLSGLPEERVEFEIAGSRKKIETEIRRPVRFFSYPYGTFLDFDPRIQSAVKKAGYEAAFSAVSGTNGIRTDRFALRRIGIEASDTPFTFRAKLNGALALLSIFDLVWMRKLIRWFDNAVIARSSANEVGGTTKQSTNSQIAAATLGALPRNDDSTVPGRFQDARIPCILLISVDFPPHKDGVSTISKELSARIAPKGMPLMVIGPADEGAGEFDALQSYRVFRLPGYDWGYLRFFPMLLAAPWIVFRHGVRKILAMNIAYGGILAWALSFLRPTEYLVFAYGYEFEKVKGNSLLRRLYLSIYHRARGIVTCSELVKERLAAFGVPREKIYTLYPGVDTQKYHPLEVNEGYLAKKGLKGRKVLLSVGRLIERKGHDQVIRALPRIVESFPEVLYGIVGVGPHEKNLRDEVSRLKLENHVRFLGKVLDEELVLLYNACEIFLMPSREIETGGHIEGFGIVFLEANACARPVIGGKSGGMFEAVRDGETGFLVDPAHPGEIAEKVIDLLSHPKEAEEMGARGLRRVRESFNWEQYTEEVLRLLC